MAMEETGETVNPWNGESELGPLQAKILEGLQREDEREEARLEKRIIQGKLSLIGLIMG